MGLLDLFNAAPQTGTGLLSPQDRLLALFSGLSQAGAAMSQPGLSRGAQFAQGMAGLGQGMQSGMQNALAQQMLGMNLKRAQQENEGTDLFGQALSSANGDGNRALASPDVMRAIALNPKLAPAISALRTEEKAPEVTDAYDPQGRKTRMVYNRQTRQFEPLGGSEVDATKPIFNPQTGRYEYAPGVVDAEAGKTGSLETAKERAGLPFVGAKAGAAAAATSPYDIAKAWAIPRVLPPGAQVVAGGGPGGAPAQVIMTSPNPSPGSQQGKYEQGIGDLQAKTVEGWRTGAEAGYVTLQNVERMKQAVDNGLKTGTFAPIRQTTVTALADLGVSQEALNKYFSAKDARTFDAAAKELVLPVVKSLGANPTDADRKFIEATIPQLRDNPEAVKSLLDWMGTRAQQKIEMYQQGYEHSSKGGDPLKFEQDWWAKHRAPKGSGANIDALLKKYAP